MKAPAFQFYAADYLADEQVMLMSLEEEGAYIRLLAYCWREGSIPADEALLARLCKGATANVIRVVIECFQPDDNRPDRLVHPRLEEERAKQQVWRNKSSEGGRKSAEKRWGKKESQPNGSHPYNGGNKGGFNGGVTLHSSSSTSSTSSDKTPPTPAAELCVLAEGSKKNEGIAAGEELPSEGSLASASHTGGAAADVATHVEFRPDPEWAPQMRLVAEQMAEFWKLGTLQQQARFSLSRFCRTVFEAGNGEALQQQFTAYRFYKQENDERVHRWETWIGKETAAYQDGEWIKNDWVAMLEAARKNPRHGIQRTTGAGRPAAAGRVASLPASAYGRKKAA
ncbi:DUF1376 domain-containing protein [Hymenobacter rigui]|uniref:DUF1376 domain-containing protein n=1 Tax=Hymenobacter rigui TaxID=334424 RepID=A0A428KTX9_9BACT|nr:DUF1376 domain-containing protein [Hymenobacter rigui]RSK50076.1 DUF1376 domain-containing protein [Hymenobacter rigui]